MNFKIENFLLNIVIPPFTKTNLIIVLYDILVIMSISECMQNKINKKIEVFFNLLVVLNFFYFIYTFNCKLNTFFKRIYTQYFNGDRVANF